MNVASDLAILRRTTINQLCNTKWDACVRSPRHHRYSPPLRSYCPYVVPSAGSSRHVWGIDHRGSPPRSPSVECLGVRAPDGTWIKQEEDEVTCYEYLRETSPLVFHTSPCPEDWEQ